MLDAKAPPTEVGLKRGLPYKKVDVFAAIKPNMAPQGVGDLLRTRQEALNLFPEALH